MLKAKPDTKASATNMYVQNILAFSKAIPFNVNTYNLWHRKNFLWNLYETIAGTCITGGFEKFTLNISP